EEAHATYVKQYKAEAHFLRAYFYWEMFLRYGPVPLVTDVLDPDGDLLSNYTTRPSLKEYVVDFILKELKDCEEGLMDKATSAESGNPGRISQPMARALYSRVMLYMASDRFRSESGISWQQAADAAQSFMTDYGTLYGLYTTDTDPKTCYTNAILKNAHDEKNNETIFWRNDVAVGWGAIYNDTPVGEGGNGGLCPSQNLVDMYDMANGQSPFSSYDETGAPVYNGTATPAINNASGYKSNDPYSNRDPRLAATVLYNGVNWGNGIINVLKGQRDNPQGNANATPTGYYTRKYIPEVILNNNHTGSNYRNWIIIRYAEILLSYAEALNNLTGPHTVELDGQPYTMSRDKEEIKKAFNQVRYRAGLPGLTANQLNSTPEVQKQIERERMVEFLWENRRFYDVRRWGIYEETEQEPIRGMNPDGATKETYYQRVIPSSSSFLTRVVDKRSVWVPIPRNEMRRLPSLDQNPGY
ncbi:MAG: RagB/SusD family nutrient uptake outer membrane protein, partial [Bacteroides thetaiotaomicron]|nr:RagB/SusD family nutrient uptake outer membrane protein [Bacteroides thetaiotaomicron]